MSSKPFMYKVLCLFLIVAFYSTVPNKSLCDSFSIKDNPYMYSNYYHDTESLLDYLEARYYSIDLMRFLNRDTYNVPNRYVYCGGNPIECTDPNDLIKDTVRGRVKYYLRKV